MLLETRHHKTSCKTLQAIAKNLKALQNGQLAQDHRLWPARIPRFAHRARFGGRETRQQSREDERTSGSRGEAASEEGRQEDQEVVLQEVRAALHQPVSGLLRENAEGIGLVFTEL